MRCALLIPLVALAACQPAPTRLVDAPEPLAEDRQTGCFADTLCADQCVDLASAADHCGACGNRCSFANAGATCVAGACVPGACAPGFADCDGNPANGCEADILFNPDSCGACGNVCPAVAAGHDRTCEASSCGAVCKPGLIACAGECRESCDDWKFVNPAVIGANSLLAAAFRSAQVGIAGGVRALVRTTDGGGSWSSVGPLLLDTIEGMDFAGDRAVAVGWSLADPINGGVQSAVLLSSDDGATWRKSAVTVNPNETLRDVSFDGAVGAAVGMGTSVDGFLITSEDQGTSWTRATLPPGTKWLHGVHRRRELIVAAGDSGLIRSTDAGRTWTQVLTAELNSVHFANDQLGLAAGGGELLYRTTDGGQSWTQVHTGAAANWLRRVRFSPDGLHAIAVGFQGLTLTSSDGGLSWTAVVPYKSAYLFAAAIVGQRVWSVGTRGVIFRSDDFGGSWSRQSPGYTATMFRAHFPDGVNGFAVGELGGILSSKDAGRTWQLSLGQHDPYAAAFVPPAATHNSLRGVFFADKDTGWAVGDPVTDQSRAVLSNAVILKTNDGGATWTLQQSGVAWGLRGVAFVDKLKGYAVGAGGILRTVNGGATWTQAPNTTSFNDIAVLGPNSAVAVGNVGAVAWTDNGGDSWTAANSGLGTLFTVRSLGGGKAIIAGSSFAMSPGFAHTVDGGKTWLKTVTTLPGMAMSVAVAADGLRAVATTESGRILRSKDGGNSWRIDAYPTFSILNDVQPVFGGFLVSGEFGGMLRGPLDPPR